MIADASPASFAHISFRAPNQKYDEAVKVQAQVELLGEYMREHFSVVRGHVAVQVDNKVKETGWFSSPFLSLYVLSRNGERF